MPIRVLNVVRDAAPAADGTTEYDLQPLPLHGLLIKVRGSADAANTNPNFGTFTTMLPRINVALAGTTLWDSSLRDLCAVSMQTIGRSPWWYGNGPADNELAQLGVYLPFGRTWAGGKWAIPGTPAGLLKLQVTADIAVTGYDTLRYDVDAVHNTNLVPDGFLRTTTLARTASATGDLDIDLPVGRWMSGISVFATTERITQAGANGIDRMRLLFDGVEDRYASIEWGDAQTINYLAGGVFSMAGHHTHISDVAAAYTQFQATQRNQETSNAGYSYAYLDLDPARGGEDLVDLRQCSRYQLRATMGTAEAVRVLPTEWWPADQKLLGEQ